MIYPVPFRAGHLRRMRLQAAQAVDQDRMEQWDLTMFEGPHSHTAMRDGEPVVCCGAVSLDAHYARLWAFLADGIRPRDFVAIHALARQFVAMLPFKRLDATVATDFTAGRRWLRSLGFVREDANGMAWYGHDGTPHALYALIKEGVL